MQSTDRPPNRLAGETSPYLLQHQHNPVDWHPWGPEALAKARELRRPIFLSIGYSACHWCHVMERESFENPDIATLMNEHFVNIKVDREERPDLDNLYMAAVQAMTGHGGWPMSVFLTPELQPFHGGTYYPPADRRGMPGFPRILDGVALAWRDRRGEVAAAASQMTAQLQSLGEVPEAVGGLDVALLDNAYQKLARAYDPRHGGFGDAPKFPHPMDLRVLLRHWHRTGEAHALEMVTHTLDRMARGGIYDQLLGGFARYSTDDRWLVPHFEKMLYDNALLATTYLEAYQATGEPDLARVARETLDYVIDRMTVPEGAFAATEDADSEGVEGKFYVWSLAEVVETLGPVAGQTFAAAYGVSESGNWEGSNILHMPRPLRDTAVKIGRDVEGLRAELVASRALLLASRDRRVPPAKDTKVLTAWNGLMLAAMAEGSAILGDARYLDAAARAAGFLLDAMRGPDGRLFRSYKDGRARLNGYLDDYACLIDGLTRLFEVSGEGRWIDAAVGIAEAMIVEFQDPEAGGFHYTGRGHEALIARQKDTFDNATPSGNAMAATALLRLASLTGREEFEVAGRRALEAVQAIMAKAPTAAGQSLIALDYLLSGGREYAVVGQSEVIEAIRAIYGRFEPGKVVAVSSGGPAAVPLLADRPARGGRVTTYICEHYVCEEPVVGLEPLRAKLAEPVAR